MTRRPPRSTPTSLTRCSRPACPTRRRWRRSPAFPSRWSRWCSRASCRRSPGAWGGSRWSSPAWGRGRRAPKRSPTMRPSRRSCGTTCGRAGWTTARCGRLRAAPRLPRRTRRDRLGRARRGAAGDAARVLDQRVQRLHARAGDRPLPHPLRAAHPQRVHGETLPRGRRAALPGRHRARDHPADGGAADPFCGELRGALLPDARCRSLRSRAPGRAARRRRATLRGRPPSVPARARPAPNAAGEQVARLVRRRLRRTRGRQAVLLSLPAGLLRGGSAAAGRAHRVLRLRLDAERHGGRAPVIGVVIPTLDEAMCLPLLLDDLRRVVVPLDIVVVDGGSSDGTPAVARSAGARAIAAPRGRARQLNAGAVTARGPGLLFLHADCRLPPLPRRAPPPPPGDQPPLPVARFWVA